MPAAYTFGGSDVLGLAGGGFVAEGVTISGSKDAAVAKGSTGDYIVAAHASFNDKEEVVQTYIANVTTGAAAPTVSLGGLAGDYIVTSVKSEGSNTGFTKITVTAHKHLDGNTTTEHYENAKSITIPVGNGFGSFDPFGTSGLTATDIQSCSWEASIEHVDKQDSAGEFLCGRSQGAKITASIDAVTDTASVADPSGWKITSRNSKQTNDDFHSFSITGEKYLA